MSVIVRMEMPSGCVNCPMGDDDSRFCKAAKRYIPMLGRPSWCPIAGVLPEEHGDLIDRDSYLKLLESYKESKRGVCENKEFIVALQAISKQIKCVKAVIAAERKDE